MITIATLMGAVILSFRIYIKKKTDVGVTQHVHITTIVVKMHVQHAANAIRKLVLSIYCNRLYALIGLVPFYALDILE